MSHPETQAKRIDQGKQHTHLNSATAQWVQAHKYHLADLPAPGEQWTGDDVDYTPQEILKMKNEGVIIRQYNNERDENYYQYYVTNEDAFEAVQTFLKQAEEKEGFLPCGHDGFVNQGDVLECKVCESEHTKAEVRDS